MERNKTMKEIFYGTIAGFLAMFCIQHMVKVHNDNLYAHDKNAALLMQECCKELAREHGMLKEQIETNTYLALKNAERLEILLNTITNSASYAAER